MSTSRRDRLDGLELKGLEFGLLESCNRERVRDGPTMTKFGS